MGLVQLEDSTTEDPEEILLSMPFLPSFTVGACYVVRCQGQVVIELLNKFDERSHLPHWKHFLNLWIVGLEP